MAHCSAAIERYPSLDLLDVVYQLVLESEGNEAALSSGARRGVSISGVDFGGNGSRHAFVATGILPLYAGVVGLASQRVDPRGQDADYLAAQLIAFCTAVFARYGEMHYIFCDSAEQTLINHIRARLRACPLFWLADRVNNSARSPLSTAFA